MIDDHVAALIETHLTRYPEAEMLDVYKLLHQATFGVGHLIASKKAAREWLEFDLGQANHLPGDEPLVENIHPEGAIVRLHLRPYLRMKGKVKPLLDAMVRSAEQVQGDPAELASCWQLFERLCQPDGPYADRFDLREVTLFGRVRANEQWPAVQHSPRYNQTYHPSYRVLTLNEAHALCDKINAAFEVV